MNIRFVYDEKDIKDIRVLFIEEEKPNGDNGSLKEDFKIFCLDTLPEELEPKVSVTEDGYLVESNDGEEVLNSMMRLLYLTMKFAELYSSELVSGKIDIEELSMDKLQPEIDKVKDLSHSEISELLGATVEHNN